MGSLQDELKKVSEAPVSKPVAAETVKQTHAVKRPSTENWNLCDYANRVSELCEELEQHLMYLVNGLEQYKQNTSESALKPGLKEFKGAIKELSAKSVQARRISNSVKSSCKS